MRDTIFFSLSVCVCVYFIFFCFFPQVGLSGRSLWRGKTFFKRLRISALVFLSITSTFLLSILSHSSFLLSCLFPSFLRVGEQVSRHGEWKSCKPVHGKSCSLNFLLIYNAISVSGVLLTPFGFKGTQSGPWCWRTPIIFNYNCMYFLNRSICLQAKALWKRFHKGHSVDAIYVH